MSFLSALLPTVLGAGLAATGVGAPLAALMVGGGYAAANGGNLRKGLMAGLGAYGGAGLASSFGTAGAGATTTLEGAAPANAITPPPAAPTPAPAANVVQDVSGTSLANATPVTGGLSESSMVSQPVGGGPMTNYQDPYASAGYEGSGMPPQPTPATVAKPEPFPGAGESYTVSPATPESMSNMTTSERLSAMGRGATLDNTGSWMSAHPYQAAGIGLSVASGMEKTPTLTPPDKDMGQRYTYSAGEANPQPQPDVPSYDDMLHKQGNFGKMQSYYPHQGYTPISNAAAYDIYHYGPKAANGGLMAAYGMGGNTNANPIERMSNENAIGANTGFPQAYMHTSQFAVPTQTPVSQNVLVGPGDTSVDPYTGEEQQQTGASGPRFGFGGFLGDAVSNIGSAIGHIGKGDSGGSSEGWEKLLENMGGKAPSAQSVTRYDPQTQQYVEVQPSQQMATGGLSDAHYNLGGYSDGGRLLRGPGDGVSDSIPAVIGKRQPARLADGEFVVPARIVSELGNGSTEAGARKLYAMMDRIQASRKKSIGRGKVAYNNKTDRHLPA